MDQHFDAERLAAFADGSLSRAERAAAEAHAADCPRCLQLLAAMARTEPAPIRRAWRLPVIVRWAVPLAAAATALALWVNVSQRDEEAVSPMATVSAPSEPQAKSEPSARQAQPAVPESQAADAIRPGNARDAARRRAGIRDEVAPLREQAVAEKAAKKEAPQRGDAAAAAPPAAPAPPAAAPGAPAPAGAAERMFSRVNESRALSTNQAAIAVEVVSPDPMRRWRAMGKVVARSIDGGKTWNVQAVPLQAEILAGASPAPNVGWLVGRAGTVMLTTDGTQWQRLDFPETVDITAVRAASDREAEVTTADGRVFRTTDGGRTWSARLPD